MKLKIINYFTYKKLNYDSVFDDSHNDSYRIYGKLVEGNFYAKIAWSSDLLQPEFLKIYPKVYAIGIDQNFAIYDFEKKKILFEATSWLGRSIIDKYIFRDFKKKIACRKIDSDSILWEFPLSSLGKGKDYSTDEEFDYEVEQFVGIYNNILWVYIERGGFIGLDIQTGELKHRILGIPKGNLLGKVDSYVDSEEFYIFYRAKFILDEKKGIIIGLIADRFFEIDLNKEKITPMLYGM